MSVNAKSRAGIEAFLGVINFLQVIVGVLSLAFIAGAAVYVWHRQRTMVPVLRVLQVRLLILLTGFLWVFAILTGDDALFHVYRTMLGRDLGFDSDEFHEAHARWCLAQKAILLTIAEPAFLLLIAQLVHFGATADASPADFNVQMVRRIARPLAPLVVVQLVLIFSERYFPSRVIFVATSNVPAEVCLVPTANLLVSLGFSAAFMVYFNIICLRLSKVVISRHVKARLWALQAWYSGSLPTLFATRLLLIVGFGFASRYLAAGSLLSQDAFLSGLLLSRFVVDVQFFVIVSSALLSVHSLVWRPLREVDRLSARQTRKFILEVEANRLDTSGYAEVPAASRQPSSLAAAGGGGGGGGVDDVRLSARVGGQGSKGASYSSTYPIMALSPSPQPALPARLRAKRALAWVRERMPTTRRGSTARADAARSVSDADPRYDFHASPRWCDGPERAASPPPPAHGAAALPPADAPAALSTENSPDGRAGGLVDGADGIVGGAASGGGGSPRPERTGGNVTVRRGKKPRSRGLAAEHSSRTERGDASDEAYSPTQSGDLRRPSGGGAF
jgi:hypothetical protein